MVFIDRFNHLHGANTQTSPFLLSEKSLTVLNGANVSRELGSILKDTGYVQVEAIIEASNSILGMFDFVQIPGTQKMLATVNNSADTATQLFYFTNVSTTVDVSSASGQLVISVTSTADFLVGDSITLAKGTANAETRVIDTISAGVSITVTVNLTNTHAVGVAVEQTWTEITAAESTFTIANTDVEMESFIAHCFLVGHNGTSFLPIGSLTGTTFSTSTNVTNMPQGRYIKRYRDRLYVANARSGGTDFPFRVYFSSVPSAGAITWTPASDFIDVDYSDEITGLGVNWDKLIIFTKKRAYFYDQQQMKQLWARGCSNHRTIVNSGIFMIWTDTDGVWLSQNGGQPQEISGFIRDFIKAGTPNNFFAEVVDEEYNLYVGAVTVNGVTYSNTMLTFNIPTQTWRWRELAQDMTMFATFDDSGSTRLYMGNTTGRVYDKAKYTDTTVYSSDAAINTATDGTAIHSEFELAPFFIEPDKYKGLDSLIAYSERAAGLRMQYRVLDRNARIMTEYKTIGTLTSFSNEFKISGKAKPGTMLQIKGTEFSTLPYWSFFGARYNVIPLGKKHD